VLAERAREGRSFWELFRGLMLRPGLDPGEGLWLSGVNNIHMFFMRFAIDVVFAGHAAGDGSRTVVAVAPELKPWRGIVWWVRGAHGVLELRAGTAAATGTVVGDRLVFE
jgi:uncharacterized membrane protein (UPF0127 family)